MGSKQKRNVLQTKYKLFPKNDFGQLPQNIVFLHLPSQVLADFSPT